MAVTNIDCNRNYVKKYCWLINRNGKRDGYLPIDQGQEQNIGDIKVSTKADILTSNKLTKIQVTYRSFGPGATWQYLNKVLPAIPTLRAVQRHMEEQFGSLSRGAHHGQPDKEADVMKLTTAYVASNLHGFEAGRRIKNSKDKSPDVMTNGAADLDRLPTLDHTFTANRTMASCQLYLQNPQ